MPGIPTGAGQTWWGLRGWVEAAGRVCKEVRAWWTLPAEVVRDANSISTSKVTRGGETSVREEVGDDEQRGEHGQAEGRSRQEGRQSLSRWRSWVRAAWEGGFTGVNGKRSRDHELEEWEVRKRIRR